MKIFYLFLYLFYFVNFVLCAGNAQLGCNGSAKVIPFLQSDNNLSLVFYQIYHDFAITTYFCIFAVLFRTENYLKNREITLKYEYKSI